MISTRDDRDLFRLDVNSGAINVSVSGASVGSNLDIEVSLYDVDGSLLETFGSDDSLSVVLNKSLSRGKYFLGVDGVGQGNPKSDGYSNYGSLGQYMITGLLPSLNESVSQQTTVAQSNFTSILASLRARRGDTWQRKPVAKKSRTRRYTFGDPLCRI